MEKIYQKKKDKQDCVLVPQFYNFADHTLTKKVKE